MKIGDRVKAIDPVHDFAYGKTGTVIKCGSVGVKDDIWVKLDEKLTSPISGAIEDTFPFKEKELELIK